VIYTECCEVLHGPKADTALCEPQVAGWEAVVERGEQVLREIGLRPAEGSVSMPT
jgi:hypothetical protein